MPATQGRPGEFREVQQPAARNAEYARLMGQRSDLNSQLHSLSERSHELFLQSQGKSPGERAEYTARIATLDARAKLLESELARVAAEIARVTSTTPGQDATPWPLDEKITYVGAPSNADFIGQMRGAIEDTILGTMFGSAFGILSVYVLWRGFKRFVLKRKAPAIVDQTTRISQLQNSVDVIALEVERISESQRYLAKVLNEKLQVGAGEAREANPVARR